MPRQKIATPAAGMNDYVSKPIDDRKLMAAINGVAGMAETAVEASAMHAADTPLSAAARSDVEDLIRALEAAGQAPAK